MTLSLSPTKTPRLLNEPNSDPHGLWAVAIVVSAIVHLLFGWALLRFTIVDGKAEAQSKQEFIQIEAVATAENSQKLAQPSPQTETSSPSNATPAPQAQSQEQPATPTPEKRKTWRWFRSEGQQSRTNPLLQEGTPANSQGQWRTSQQIARANAQRSSGSSSQSILQNSPAASGSSSRQSQKNTVQRRSSSSNAQSIMQDTPVVAASSSRSRQRRSSSNSQSIMQDTPVASGSSSRSRQRQSSSNSQSIMQDTPVASGSRSGSSKSSSRSYSGSGGGSIWNDGTRAQGSPKPWNQRRGNTGSPTSGGNGNPQSSGSSQGQPPASGSPQVKGVTATVSTPRLTRSDRDIPDKLATPKQSSQQLSVLPAGVRLNGPVVLEVVAVIEANGKPTVYRTKIVSGSIAQEQGDRIAKQIVEGWSFEPTYMADQPVAQEYFIQLSLSPILN